MLSLKFLEEHLHVKDFVRDVIGEHKKLSDRQRLESIPVVINMFFMPSRVLLQNKLHLHFKMFND